VYDIHTRTVGKQALETSSSRSSSEKARSGRSVALVPCSRLFVTSLLCLSESTGGIGIGAMHETTDLKLLLEEVRAHSCGIPVSVAAAV
jgi:hypothetical protein